MLDMKRLGIIAVLVFIIAPLSIMAGDIFWQSALKDFLGMRPMDECVKMMLDRNLRPQVIESSLEYSTESRRDLENFQPLYLQSQELLDQNLDLYFSDVSIDQWTERVVKETSCKNFDTIHFIVRNTLGEKIQAYTWDAIRSEIDP
jgi:hypothetical protein